MGVMTVEELASRWSVCTLTILRKIHRNEIQAFNIGSNKRPIYRIQEKNVLEYESKTSV